MKTTLANRHKFAAQLAEPEYCAVVLMLTGENTASANGITEIELNLPDSAIVYRSKGDSRIVVAKMRRAYATKRHLFTTNRMIGELHGVGLVGDHLDATQAEWRAARIQAGNVQRALDGFSRNGRGGGNQREAC